MQYRRKTKLWQLLSGKENEEHPQKKLRSATPSKLLHLCIICQQSRYDKQWKNLIPLRQCTTLDPCKKLLKAAEHGQDTTILRELQVIDPIAAGVYYHPNCYSNYMRRYIKDTDRDVSSLSTTNMDAYNQAFSNFANCTKDALFEEQQIMNMSEQRNCYNDSLKQHGLSPQTRSQKLKNKLQKYSILENRISESIWTCIFRSCIKG